MAKDLELICPVCGGVLEQIVTAHGTLWKCHPCKGRAINIRMLQNVSNSILIRNLWEKAQSLKKIGTKDCPACSRKMLVASTGHEFGGAELDLCHTCYLMWFDQVDLAGLPKAKTPFEVLPVNVPKGTPANNSSGPFALGNSLEIADAVHRGQIWVMDELFLLLRI